MPTRSFLFGLALFALLALSQNAYAADEAILIGHNVTPTTEIPSKNTWTIGNYALGYSVSQNLFIATSPWIWASYNTANVHIKWMQPISRKSKWAFFASYFESYPSSPFLEEINGSTVTNRPTSPPSQGSGRGGSGGPFSTLATTTTGSYEISDRYQWQSANAHILYSHEFSRSWTTYFNVHYGYFWNDDFPYSIRMDPGRDSIRGQVDVTTLTSLRLFGSRWRWLTELGGLGLNYQAPYFQFGQSLAYVGESWLVQLGASSTMQFGEMFKASGWTPGRYDDRLHYSQSEGESYYYRYLQTALHPEIHIQFFF